MNINMYSQDSNPCFLPCLCVCRDYEGGQFAENPVPLLLIGTKYDQIPENKRNDVLTRTAFLSEDFNAEEINLVGIPQTWVEYYFKYF